MDDRVLLVPPVFAPDPDFLRGMASTAILISRLEERWPVDFVRWPTLKGEPTNGDGWLGLIDAVHAVAREYHHVLDVSFGGGSLVMGLTRMPPRSLAVAGFAGTLASLRDAGHPELADATQISQSIMTVPGQFLPFIMQGAAEAELSHAERLLEATLDKELLTAIFARVADVVFAELVTLRVPAVFFVLQPPFPGGEVEYEIYQSIVPGVRRDELAIWPGQMQRSDGGHELADKVIPFIAEVIASRAKG